MQACNRLKFGDSASIHMYYSRPLLFPIKRLLKGTILFRSKLLVEQLVARVKSPVGKTRLLSDQHQFSPQETVLACLVTDERRRSTNTLLVNVSRHRNDIIDTIFDTHYCVLPNERELLYVRCDEHCRPYQVWLHRNGQDQCNDVLLFEETRPSCHMTVAMTRDNEYVTVTSSTRTSSEVRILPNSSLQSPRLVRPLQSGVHYYIDHAHNRFYILTDFNSEYEIMSSCDDEPESWFSYFTSPDNFIIQDIELFSDFLLIIGTTRSLTPAVIIKPTSTRDQQHRLICYDGFSDIQKPNQPFHADTCKLILSSLVSPPTLKEVTLRDDVPQSVLLADSRYALEKTTAVSADGTSVPISLFYEPRLLAKDDSNPLLAKVYGSHGLSVSMRYDVRMMSLIRRGWVIAFCHIRGGGELGRKWYSSALGANKMKSFEDLLACLSHLHESGYAQPHSTAVWGRSAGGLPVAMLCNLWPHLLQAAVLEYPVVNLSSCLTNGTHYVSKLDATEFGDSNDALTNAAVQSACPTANLSCQDYPSIMVLASRADELVPFATVEQFVDSLSDCVLEYQAKRLNDKKKLLQRFFPHQRAPSQLPRGTVVFQTEETSTHYNYTSNVVQHLNQGCKISVFLHKSLGLPMNVIL